jgi:hypothetical protein
MKEMEDRLVMSRLARREDAGRDFDIEFWQTLGDAKIFAAAWDLVVTAAGVRGIREDQLRLQRSVATLRRRSGAFPRGRRLRGDQAHGAVLHEGSGRLD